MIAVDTQILVYAHRGEMPMHGPAVGALRQLVEGGIPWAIPWPCVHEFTATVTRPRYFDPPSSLEDAFTAIDRLRISSMLQFIGEGADHLDRLRHLAVVGRAHGPLIHDARIAAICFSHGVTSLWTVDRDFSRFPELPVYNPLQA
jgi:predicted nucleic acid-binding protein